MPRIAALSRGDTAHCSQFIDSSVMSLANKPSLVDITLASPYVVFACRFAFIVAPSHSYLFRVITGYDRFDNGLI